jgi:hypothetical protein
MKGFLEYFIIMNNNIYYESSTNRGRNMGSQLVSFSFESRENEQIEAVIKLPKEVRSVIHGVVKDNKNRVIKDAVVKLFRVKENCTPYILEPITHTFTDECGQFLFGPLKPRQKYVVKVWVDDIKIRELIIKPNECDKVYNERKEDMDYFEKTEK